MDAKSKAEGKTIPSERWIRKRLSGFQFFLRACLDKLRSRYPSSSIVLSQVFKMCAENWKKMDDSVKKRFRNKAKAEQKAKVVSQPAAKSSAKLKLERIRPVFKSQRPLSPYMLFCKDWRSVAMQKYPTYSLGQISLTLADMWMNTDEETKVKYRRLTRNKREHNQKGFSASKLQNEIKTIQNEDTQ